jgi:hypothetical protein
MGFKESMLKGKIDGLKHNIAITEKLSPNSERLRALREQLAIAEAQLEKLRNSN